MTNSMGFVPAVFEVKSRSNNDATGQLSMYAFHTIIDNIDNIFASTNINPKERPTLENLPDLAGLAIFGFAVHGMTTNVIAYHLAEQGGLMCLLADDLCTIKTANIAQAALGISCYNDFLRRKYFLAMEAWHKRKTSRTLTPKIALQILKPHVLRILTPSNDGL